ncbi:MAG: hypothetical protein U1F43_27900 [Myxococcota bacterium]
MVMGDYRRVALGSPQRVGARHSLETATQNSIDEGRHMKVKTTQIKAGGKPGEWPGK